MELHAAYVSVRNRRGKSTYVVGCGQGVSLFGIGIIRMDKIHIFVIGEPVEQGMPGLYEMYLVPSHVGDFEPRFNREFPHRTGIRERPS